MCVMSRGRWSDVRSCTALQEVRRAISGEAKEMSGEVCLVLESKGLRVGVSELLRMMWLGSRLIMASPRLSETWVVRHAGS